MSLFRLLPSDWQESPNRMQRKGKAEIKIKVKIKMEEMAELPTTQTKIAKHLKETPSVGK